MKKKKLLSLSIASALILAAFSGCGTANEAQNSEDSNELRVIRVANMTGQPDQYADYIGIEQGIFEKYGISLETSEFSSGMNTIDAVSNGTADTGMLSDYATATRLGNTLNDTNLVIVSDLGSSVPEQGGLYVAPQYADDLNTLNDSEGWITYIGTVYEYFNWQAMQYVGLDPAKQTIVQSDSTATSLAAAHNGEAAAAIAIDSAAKRYENEGWKLVATPKEIGIDLTCYMITTSDFAENNTDLLADYLKAIDESTAYINDNLDACADKISEKFGIEVEDFKANWSQYTMTYGLAEKSAAHLDAINNWAYEQGKNPEQFNIRQFYYTEPAEKALPENVTVDLSSVKQ